MMWGGITMWYMAIGIALTAVFTVVALIFGASDLIFMLKELLSMETDETDDGRVPVDSKKQ